MNQLDKYSRQPKHDVQSAVVPFSKLPELLNTTTPRERGTALGIIAWLRDHDDLLLAPDSSSPLCAGCDVPMCYGNIGGFAVVLPDPVNLDELDDGKQMILLIPFCLNCIERPKHELRMAIDAAMRHDHAGFLTPREGLNG